MTATDSTDSTDQPVGPYAHAAPAYWAAGWRGLLPLPQRAKAPVPAGWTGGKGLFPSYPDVHAWTEGPQGRGNLALRLPHHVVGIDVDDYAGKGGGATFAELCERFGTPPQTWRSTSRDDGVSGIRLYRVPEGLAWPGDLGPGIEVIQHRHRYTVVWPSVHPEGRTYRWIDPDGHDVIGTVPGVDDLPDLLEAWVQGITRGVAATDVPRLELDDRTAGAWLDARGKGTPCRAVAAALRRYTGDLDGKERARHDVAMYATARLAHLAAEGHTGVEAALASFKAAFLAATADPKRTHDPAEWNRLLGGAVRIAAADPQGHTDPCENPFHGLLPDRPAVYVPPDRPEETQWNPDPTSSGSSTSSSASAPSSPSSPATPASPVPADISGLIPPSVAGPSAPSARPSPSDSEEPPARRLILTPASAIKPRRVKWLWDGRIALGTLSLLAGREGLGKSTVAYWLAARITRGELPGEYRGVVRSVLVCATEDSWEHTIVPRLMAAGADLDRIYRLEVVSAEEIHVGLSLPRDLVATEAAAKDLEAGMLLLDPLMSRLDAKLDSHRDGEVRQALEPLAAIADRTNMAILGLIHHNKSGGSDPLDAVMGSKAFAAVARSVHTAMRDPDDETEERRLFGTPKNNLGRTDLPTLTFTIAGHRIETDEGDNWTGKVIWGEDSTTTIRQAMETALKGGGLEERTAAQEAGDWLYDWLQTQGGEAFSAEAKKAAMASDRYSERALNRGLEARKNLIGVRSEGFPRRTLWFIKPLPVATVPGDLESLVSTQAVTTDLGEGVSTVMTGTTGSDLQERSVTGTTGASSHDSRATTPLRASATGLPASVVDALAVFDHEEER